MHSGKMYIRHLFRYGQLPCCLVLSCTPFDMKFVKSEVSVEFFRIHLLKFLSEAFKIVSSFVVILAPS